MDVVEFVDGSVRITVEDLLFVVDFSDGVGFDFFRFLFLLCFLLSIIQIRMNTINMDRSIFKSVANLFNHTRTGYLASL